MYIQKINRKQNGKIYTSTILAESYRQDGKMKRRIIANLTKVPKDIVSGIQKFLKEGKAFELNELSHSQGKSCGALIVIQEVARRLGITKQLGNSIHGKLALFQIAARIVTQKSRLFAANDWKQDQAVEEIFGLKDFTEDNLYYNLDWLCDRQIKVEDGLFKEKKLVVKEIYLYDVTSSYLEGDCNELANYGYNRDQKKGKKQIVIGLLCDNTGDPISVEVFEGNTSDPKTVQSQLQKLRDRFGVEKVVFVGDKGMIKSTQISNITEEGYNYITSISKTQLGKLIKDGIIQYELFEKQLAEIEHEGVRYIMRRNPSRAEEVKANRKEKIIYLEGKIKKENLYLKEHKRAKPEIALKRIDAKIKDYKLTQVLKTSIEDNEIVYWLDEEELEVIGKFDGCYVIKTDLAAEFADKETIHQRYKDLANVEMAFRTLKTGLEEVRPIFVRKESRTRGHVFICMLAYKIVKYIWDELKYKTSLTRKGIFETLDKIQFIEYEIAGHTIKKLPKELLAHQKQIFDELDIKIPSHL